MKSLVWLMILVAAIPLNCLAADSVNVRVSVTIPELPKVSENKEKDNNTAVAGNQNESPSQESETTTLRDNLVVLLKTSVAR